MPELEYVPVTRKSEFLLMLTGIAIFFVFFIFFDADEALACSAIAGAFIAVIQTKPKGQRNRQWWTVIGVVALVHVALLIAVSVPKLKFGLVAVPFVLADALCIWRITKWADRPHRSS